MATGQAGGTAAALSIKTGINPAFIDCAIVRKTLKENSAIIP
jgi:hypothetical protein